MKISSQSYKLCNQEEETEQNNNNKSLAQNDQALNRTNDRCSLHSNVSQPFVTRSLFRGKKEIFHLNQIMSANLIYIKSLAVRDNLCWWKVCKTILWPVHCALTKLSCNFTELIEHIQGRAAPAATVCFFPFCWSICLATFKR